MPARALWESIPAQQWLVPGHASVAEQCCGARTCGDTLLGNRIYAFDGEEYPGQRSIESRWVVEADVSDRREWTLEALRTKAQAAE